ncbi:LytTR family transcriptional regulator [Bifidobacterium myosotis]|uniref:LytTR family transcriptional regulator n=1 Tax=Bifidobacterium myosotis TaxID=1630166 RepID=A0A261FEU6_9BIFI|nr:LytTR family DNA-binding domain-containing protein [Bifidobacterium myosotis]OZG57700.1 LytTR family transcriptional regulator [Bifidobacterium myosotis]
MIGGRETVAESLTRELIHRFYSGDARWLAGHFAPDFTGIGAQSEQYRISVDDILRNTGVMPDLVFVRERYEQVAQSGDMTVVMGQYAAYVAPGQEMAFADIQRFTVIWRDLQNRDLQNRDLQNNDVSRAKLVHWHLSNPLRASVKGERFPRRTALGISRAMSLMTEQKRYQRELQIQDVTGATHRLLLFDLQYVESAGHNTVLHMTDGAKYVVHRGLGAFLADTGLEDDRCGFVRVHRGYAVNALYVRSVSDCVTMVNGDTLPVPQRKVTVVRETIAAARIDDDMA